MREWNENFSEKRTVNGKTIIIGQQNFEDSTIMIKEPNENIIDCPMLSDENGDIFFVYDNMGVYVSSRLADFPIENKTEV